MNFNKVYENIFKPASDEEVKERKNISIIEKFKDWLTTHRINFITEDNGNITILDKGVFLYDIKTNLTRFLNIKILEILKYNNIDFNEIRSKEGTPLLNYVIGIGISSPSYNDIIKYLLDNGADVNSINRIGKRNALQTAYSHGYDDNTDIVKLLKSYGAK